MGEWRLQYRAGFMEAPVYGPSANTPTRTDSPRAKGAAFLATEALSTVHAK